MKEFRLLLWLLLTMVMGSLHAQTYTTDFGQNRIQYKDFDWHFYSTTNFDIYFYTGGGDYAKEAIDFLEEEFDRLTDLLGYAPYTKTKIFLYNSIHDLQQSNTGIDGATFTIGGQTDFVKLQLEIAHPGSAIEFRKELVYRMARILIEDMMFGGSLIEIFQSSYLLSLPRWFIDGAARYLAYGWDSEMDDYIRDYMSKKKAYKLIKIDGGEAGLVGQSVWNYIALTHGKSNIANILNLTRIIRSEENSIASTIGVGYRQFLKNWQAYYQSTKEEVSKDYKAPSKNDLVFGKKNPEFKYKNVRISPSGERVAYSINALGKYAVYVKELESGKTKKILKGGIIVPGQKVDEDLPLLDWVDDDNLGVVYYKRGFLYLSRINISSGEKITKPLTRFKQVKSFAFNDNGRLAVVSGDVDGRTDLYLISMRRSAVRRITKDSYDDQEPTFIPGTAAIVFSSNRPSDSLRVKGEPLEDLDDMFNLFIYDLDTTKTSFYRLTNTLGNETKPQPKSESEIFYLSDERGISNLYKYNFHDSTHTQITNYQNNIKDYDLHFDEDGITFLMLNEGTDKIYYSGEVDFNKTTFTPQTPRQRLAQAKFIAERYADFEFDPQPVAPPKDSISITEKEEAAPTDSTEVDLENLDTDNYVFGDDETIEESEKTEEIVDTEDYVFEDDEGNVEKEYRPNSFFSNYRKLQQENEIIGPLPYFPRFSFSNLVTSFAIDPLRGFGTLFETQVTDLLENHKINAGALIITDFRSSDLFLEYQYLKKWVDFSLRVDNELLVLEEDFDANQLVQRYALTTIEAGASFPISNYFRFEINPFFATTKFTNLQFEAVNQVNNNPNLAPDNRNNYFGGNVSAVYDNTVERGFNIRQGTRAKFDITQYVSLEDRQLNFGNISLDARHYQKVHREITLATRLFAGHFFGPNRQTYLLGGVPNWLLNSTNRRGANNPFANISNDVDNSNFLFLEYVTNLRGFDYGELFGVSTLVFNAELRIPVFQYFSRGPISSSFLRNFQLVGFFDVGSAWDGIIPLSPDSNVTEVQFDPQGAFSASIANFQNPWLSGVGAGLRTVILGYYAKFDVARPIRDGELGGYRFYVSLGLDF